MAIVKYIYPSIHSHLGQDERIICADNALDDVCNVRLDSPPSSSHTF